MMNSFLSAAQSRASVPPPRNPKRAYMKRIGGAWSQLDWAKDEESRRKWYSIVVDRSTSRRTFRTKLRCRILEAKALMAAADSSMWKDTLSGESSSNLLSANNCYVRRRSRVSRLRKRWREVLDQLRRRLKPFPSRGATASNSIDPSIGLDS
jgi:hypothetical protein